MVATRETKRIQTEKYDNTDHRVVDSGSIVEAKSTKERGNDLIHIVFRL